MHVEFLVMIVREINDLSISLKTNLLNKANHTALAAIVRFINYDEIFVPPPPPPPFPNGIQTGA
jgi:hypothetical protein